MKIIRYLLVVLIMQSIFFKVEAEQFPLKFYKQFSGKINNKYLLQMSLRSDGKTVSGVYYYNRVGEVLQLKGTIDNNGNMLIKEYYRPGVQTGLFKVKFTATNVISGTWSKPSGSGILSFSANELNQLEEFNNTSIETVVKSQTLKKALLGQHGFSFQRIKDSIPGKLNVFEINKILFISGKQDQKKGKDYILVYGFISVIYTSEFKFIGTIITQTNKVKNQKPCKRDGEMTFRVVNKSNIWRLQENKNPCDNQSDLIDITLK